MSNDVAMNPAREEETFLVLVYLSKQSRKMKMSLWKEEPPQSMP